MERYWMESYQLRMCPRCSEERPADDFREFGGSAICFDCDVIGESTALDDYNEQAQYRREGRCAARMRDGDLCGATAEVIDENGRLVCRAHGLR